MAGAFPTPMLHQRRHTLAALLALLVLAPLASSGATLGEAALVTAVVDGDTIRVEYGGHADTVRLIGVDTPELAHRDQPGSVDQPFARAATERTRELVGGKTVGLQFEFGDRRDHYGRLLAYVFLPDGTFVNRELLREGWARAYTRYPFRYAAAFRAVQDEARGAQRGLWATPPAASPGPIVGNRRTHIYHRPGQSHYDQVSTRNRVYFDSEAAALDAGYEPARR